MFLLQSQFTFDAELVELKATLRTCLRAVSSSILALFLLEVQTTSLSTPPRHVSGKADNQGPNLLACLSGTRA